MCELELSVFAGHNFSAMSPCAQRVHVHDSKGVLSTGVGWRGRSPVSEAIVLLFKGNFQMIIGDGALVGIDSRSQVGWHLWCCSLYPSWAAAVLSADKVVQYTPSPTNEPHTQVQTAIFFCLMAPLGLADSVKVWIGRTALLVTMTVVTIY